MTVNLYVCVSLSVFTGVRAREAGMSRPARVCTLSVYVCPFRLGERRGHAHLVRAELPLRHLRSLME